MEKASSFQEYKHALDAYLGKRGEAHSSYQGTQIETQIFWRVPPPLPSELAALIGEACNLSSNEQLTLSIYGAMFFPCNGWSDGRSEFGDVAEWVIRFGRPAAW